MSLQVGARSRPLLDVRIRLLAGFELRRGRMSVSLPQGAQRLLVYLALQGQAVQRGRVAGALWPDASEGHAAGCLRSTLWRLHRLDPHVVDASGCELRLRSNVRVDLDESYRLARQLLNGNQVTGTSTADAEAVEGLDADLLPDWYLDDWLVLHREQWRQLRLHALEILAVQQVHRGAYAAAVQSALAAVRGEPLRESANRCLIEVHLAEGNVMEAVRTYHRFRRMLLSELGVEPTARLTDLVRAAVGSARAREVAPVH